VKLYNLNEDEEHNQNDKNWILVPNQLEEGSHMLLEQTIEVDLSDDPNNLNIIKLGKSLNEDEILEFVSTLK